MKTMKRMVLLPLIAGMIAFVSGCTPPPVPTHVTGGGKLVREGCDGYTATFGFNVQVVDLGSDKYTAYGQFQLVDHQPKGKNLIIHGTFNDVGYASEDEAWAEGICTIKGLDDCDGEYPFTLGVKDNGSPGVCDSIDVCIDIPKCCGKDLKYKGTLDGGNIQVHYAKEED